MSFTHVQRAIDRVEGKLRGSKLPGKYSEIIDDILKHVIPFWDSKWRDDPLLRGVINKSRLSREIEESIPPIRHIFQVLQSQSKEKRKSKLVLFDCGSGKGILSILVASLLHLCPTKYKASIDHILLIDSQWGDIPPFSLPLSHLKDFTIENMKAKYCQTFEEKEAEKYPTPKNSIISTHLNVFSQAFGIDLLPLRANIFDKDMVHLLKGYENGDLSILFIGIHLW